MTTIHSYTNDQKISTCLTATCATPRPARHHSDHDRDSKAIALVILKLKASSTATLRVPTPTVSIVDFTAQIEKPTTTGRSARRTRRGRHLRFKGILAAVDEPLVSIDFKGDPHSSSVDLPVPGAGQGRRRLRGVVTWYDNEWGYSVRTADLAALMASKL